MANRLPLVVPVLLLLAAGPIPQDAGDTLVVTRKETRLRAGKRLFAPPVADLREGDKLAMLARQGAWLQARYQTFTGWLHETDVSARLDVRLSGEGVRETYTASEAAAARKGFNPQVERGYRASNPALEAAFAKVDRIQARRVDEQQVRTFLQEGGLWREDGQ
jgi:hypothetical protein